VDPAGSRDPAADSAVTHVVRAAEVVERAGIDRAAQYSRFGPSDLDTWAGREHNRTGSQPIAYPAVPDSVQAAIGDNYSQRPGSEPDTQPDSDDETEGEAEGDPVVRAAQCGTRRHADRGFSRSWPVTCTFRTTERCADEPAESRRSDVGAGTTQ
jgi:hypothetical protein